MAISILGCGWYGKSLAKALLDKGTVVKGSSASPENLKALQALGIQPYLTKFEAGNASFLPDFFDCDILIVSIPPKLKTGGGSDYLRKIKRVIAACVQYHVKKVVYISSTGVYGDHNSEVNELSDARPDTASGLVLLDAEKLFQNQPAFKATVIRFGGLVGPGRHPGRFFAGKASIPNGLTPVNLIHQSDCVAITTAIIEQDAFGHLFNAVSPDHPPKAHYYSLMAVQANLPLPEFVNELNNWKIVNSVKLQSSLNYTFIFDDWASQAQNV